MEEYRRYAGIKVRVLNEQVRAGRQRNRSELINQFIELFDTDLVAITAPPQMQAPQV